MLIRKQLDEIRAGGMPVLKRKSVRAASLLARGLMHLAMFPAALLGLAIVRLVSPLVLVRFGWIKGDRIGHYMLDMELYFCEKDLGIQPRSLDFFYYRTPACNLWLKEHYAGRVRVSPLVETFDIVNRLIPGGDRHSIFIKNRDLHGSRDQDGLFLKVKTHLEFTPSEVEEGERAIRTLGVPGGAEFICIHNRDSAYLDNKRLGVDWSYHDFRNNSIHTFYLAVEELLGRGYYVIRMGQVVQEPMRISHPKLIDYPMSGMRSDFLDIYISSRCKYFVLSQCGISAVPEVLRNPIVFVHAVPIGITQSFTPHCISIYKKYRRVGEERFLSFTEVLAMGAAGWLEGRRFREAGIEIVDNTPEEILDVVVEMEQRLKGEWVADPGDDELQHRFWAMFANNPMHGVFVSRIGAKYSRANRHFF